MNKTSTQMQQQKDHFFRVYKELNNDYKIAIRDTFKELVTCKIKVTKSQMPFEVASVIAEYQEKKGYTDQVVCDKVNDLIQKKDSDANIFLDIDVYRKIKYRNTQTSHQRTGWLEKIAEVLEFSPEEYRKNLTDAGKNKKHAIITQASSAVCTIESIYDMLNEEQRNAITRLANSLLKIQENYE